MSVLNLFKFLSSKNITYTVSTFSVLLLKFVFTAWLLESSIFEIVKIFNYSSFILSVWPYLLSGTIFILSSRLPIKLNQKKNRSIVDGDLLNVHSSILFFLIFIVFFSLIIGFNYLIFISIFIFSVQATINHLHLLLRSKSLKTSTIAYSFEFFSLLLGLSICFFYELNLQIFLVFNFITFLILFIYALSQKLVVFKKFNSKLFFSLAKEGLMRLLYNSVNFFRDNADLFIISIFSLLSIYELSPYYKYVYYSSFAKITSSMIVSNLSLTFAHKGTHVGWNLLKKINFFSLSLFFVFVPISVFFLITHIFNLIDFSDTYHIITFLRMLGIFLGVFYALDVVKITQIKSGSRQSALRLLFINIIVFVLFILISLMIDDEFVYWILSIMPLTFALLQIWYSKI